MHRALTRLLLPALALALVLTGCAARNAAPVIKLGVIAPFEGEGRPLGYAVLPAIKEAVREANDRGSFGPYRLAVVAFNDDLDPAVAAAQARALALDPDVLAVIGPFTPETAASAAPILAAAGLPGISLSASDPAAVNHDANVLQARTAATALIEALAAAIAEHPQPTRQGVSAALQE